MTRRLRILFVTMMTSFLLLLASAGVTATLPVVPTAMAGSCGKSSAILTFPPWYDGLCKTENNQTTIESPNDAGGLPNFVKQIAINIVTMLLYLVGYVSLAFIIWGGFKFMISGDNANGAAAARKTIINAIIGMVLAIMAVAIVKLVGSVIVK